jgi:hypothetical protein
MRVQPPSLSSFSNSLFFIPVRPFLISVYLDSTHTYAISNRAMTLAKILIACLKSFRSAASLSAWYLELLPYPTS